MVGLGMFRIKNRLTQHLIAAANADDRYALGMEPFNGFFITMFPQIQQILLYFYCLAK